MNWQNVKPVHENAVVLNQRDYNGQKIKELAS
jgi:hypothetical protein